MGKSMIMFVFVNCPRVKNQSSRFTIDNIFFDSTYRAPRYTISFAEPKYRARTR